MHSELLKITISQCFFKKFQISDLEKICRIVFDKRQKSSVGDGYPSAKHDIQKPLQLIWEFIIQEQEQFTGHSRSNLIKQLDPIKDWPLIPVTASSGFVVLAPFSHIEKIRKEGSTFKHLKQLLCQFPETRSNFFDFDESFQTNFRQFIGRLAMDPYKRPSDFFSFFLVLWEHSA